MSRSPLSAISGLNTWVDFSLAWKGTHFGADKTLNAKARRMQREASSWLFTDIKEREVVEIHGCLRPERIQHVKKKLRAYLSKFIV